MTKIISLLLCAALLQPNAQYQMLNAERSMADHPWYGLRVAFLGDSITDPKAARDKEKWWTFLERWLHLTAYVYAVSGRQWKDLPKQADQLKAQHGDDVDAILVFMGTNDFNAAVPVGEWFDETEEQVLAAVHAPKAMTTRKKRTPRMDNTTYRGRINIALDKLKRMYPTKQIVLLTPIHRAYAEFSDNNIQPTEAYQNACGEYFDRYVESVKEAGNIWAVPVIDLNAACGLFPLMEEHHPYFRNSQTDQLHPSDAGYERIARTMLYQLAALPGKFLDFE